MDAVGEKPERLRLHIGGRQPKPGWKILNIQAGPDVDYVGDCTSLAQFADGSVAEVYASHVYEHLGFRGELPQALREVWRVLEPGGVFRISVPDFECLCRLFVDPNTPRDKKFSLMMHVFGAQEDPHDFHKVGLTQDFLVAMLQRAGFSRLRRVKEFGLFNDYSSYRRFGVLISLNLEAYK
ncbi:MAG TPA: methyltransferase domain-containing protein [Thiobacillaceae bacterium]|nr:methyltransferase domain-containing protein [Thiobacillaceae bacterium]